MFPSFTITHHQVIERTWYMWIGIDFGTTNSAAAIYYGGDTLDILPLNSLSPNSRTIRTIMYIERNHKIHIGEEAIRIYYEQNSGRIPQAAKKYIGTIEVTDGLGTRLVPTYADVDDNLPGRLIHSLKGELTKENESTRLFGKIYSLDDLIAEYLSILHFRITRYIESEIDGVVFGRPVNFAGAEKDKDSEFAQTRLENSAKMAGFQNVKFELEPIAAGLGFQLKNRLDDPKNILIFDFGGGTIDIAIIHMENGKQEVLATGGLGIAGDKFDQLIARKKMLPWFGRDVTFGPQNLPLPKYLTEEILEWQNIPHLYNLKIIDFLHNAQKDASNPFQLFAFEELISKNYGYSLFEVVETAKVELSHKRFVIIDFRQDETSIWQPLTRSEFENIIATERKQIYQVVTDTILKANQKIEDIDFVVRTGGSSSIPAFIEMLVSVFGEEKVIEEDIFTGVVSGLAIKAYEISKNLY